MLRNAANLAAGVLRPYKYDRQGNIVLHAYKAIYLYIPKVACSSIKLALADLLNIPSPDPENKQAFPHKRNYPYVRRDEISDRYKSYFRFAFVRNPWDRVLSCYQNKIVGVREGRFGERRLPIFMRRDSDKFSLDMTFREFVEVLADIKDCNADVHYRSQFTFLEDRDGRLMTDFIGRFENLVADFEEIKKEIGAQQLHLPHVMKSKRERAYREYYDSNTKALVAERFRKDIELFGYEF